MCARRRKINNYLYFQYDFFHNNSWATTRDLGRATFWAQSQKFKNGCGLFCSPKLFFNSPLYDHRPSHPYNPGTEHVGFSPTGRYCLHQAPVLHASQKKTDIIAKSPDNIANGSTSVCRPFFYEDFSFFCPSSDYFQGSSRVMTRPVFRKKKTLAAAAALLQDPTSRT